MTTAMTDGSSSHLRAYQKPDDEAWDDHMKKVLGQLQEIYHSKIKPVEEKFSFDAFRPSWFSETLVQTKPFVTFMGPFSAGKSTFINHLLESNYLWTGPQPTTDKFTVVMHGDSPQQIGGRILANQPDLPFRGLNAFGDAFLEHLDGYQVPHDLLRSVTLIDTPGVLEASSDIHSRRYDYIKVSKWFVERSDLVFVLFDPTKLDAGVELRMLFKHALKGNESKIRIILNKADSVGSQELLRVYGSLFWNLSNMINATEPPRVFVGSFWDKPYRPGTNHVLFTEEKSDLLYDLTEMVPLQSLDKRVTSVLRRVKEVLVHALVCSYLKQQMPKWFGKDKAKKQAIENIQKVFDDIQLKFKFITQADFASPAEYENFFGKIDLLDFPRYERLEKEGHVATLKKLLERDLPELLNPIKTAAAADPRDRNTAATMQERYHSRMAHQLAGKAGIQGALGEQAPTAWRSGVQHTELGKQIHYNPAIGPTGSGSLESNSPAPSPPPQNSQADMMAQMQAMMQQMMQMQQMSQQPQQQQQQPSQQQQQPPQQQQQQEEVTPSAPPQPSQPDMMNMMQMMMQMQQQQQQGN